MLEIFFGTDQTKVRTEALANLAKKEINRLEVGSYVPGQLLFLAEGNSIFGESMAYLIDTPSENEQFFAEVLENAQFLASSPHKFVLVDKALLAADKKTLTKFANSITEYKKEAESEFNPFALNDALVARDKRKLWILLQEAWAAGIPTEEIIGILWWQLKTLRLAALTKNASEAGLKDFPYRKAKAALSTFSKTLAEEKSRSLTRLYHDARWGKGDLKQQLEIWVLTL